MEKNGPMLGGAIGKHESCPKDAAHAHQLASGKNFSKTFTIDYSILCKHIRIYSGIKVTFFTIYSRWHC